MMEISAKVVNSTYLKLKELKMGTKEALKELLNHVLKDKERLKLKLENTTDFNQAQIYKRKLLVLNRVIEDFRLDLKECRC